MKEELQFPFSIQDILSSSYSHKNIHAFFYSYEIKVTRQLFDDYLPYQDLFECSTAVLNLENKNKLLILFKFSLNFVLKTFISRPSIFRNHYLELIYDDEKCYVNCLPKIKTDSNNLLCKHCNFCINQSNCKALLFFNNKKIVSKKI